MPHSGTRIGDYLVKHGAVSRHALEAIAHRAQGRLGDFLRAHGLVNGQELAKAIAAQQQLDTVNLHAHAPDASLFCPRDLPHYLTQHYVPYARDENGLILATAHPSEALHAFACAHYGEAVTLRVTTRRELAHYFATRAATTQSRHACLSLRRRFRHLVADRILVPHQLRGLGVLGVGLIALFLLAPANGWLALLVLCNCFYVASLLVKLEFYRQGAAAHAERKAKEATVQKAVAALDPASLPLYSILVPMYHESEAVLTRLIAHLSALDYPKEKLDIKLLCEADDESTLAALKALRPPAMMEIMAIPPSSPRTKPKACNVALPHVRGEYMVIYDAEDAPAPDQLKRAVAMFRAGDAKLACLQGALNYLNRDENTLTQLFSIEYSALFNLLLPGLERMGLPIPLGGTSNHLKTAILREVGGWDAFNVTEDADLGIRLHYFGYATSTLPSLTLEEATLSIRAWLKQRTRWIKGYIQTWLVFTRDTRDLKQRLGQQGYYGFQFFIGAPALTFLLAPVFWVVFVVSWLGVFGGTLPPAMQWLCAVAMVGGLLSHWLFARKVMEIEGWHHLRLAFWLYPLYWVLHSLAAGRALWQLITAPHYWDKTQHGVSEKMPAAIATFG